LLNVLHRLLDEKQAVMTHGEGGFFMDEKAFNEHLPWFLGTHYFTRNRTRGSDFPPLSPHMGGSKHRPLLLSLRF
jgi:hypothetical protein